MPDEELIRQCRESGLPKGLAELVEQFISANAALQPVHPPELHYQLEFAERVLLRELIAPEKHDNHWWHTGLHIVSEAIAREPALAKEHSAALTALWEQLDQRLGPYQAVTLQEINAKSVTGICLLSELMTFPQNSFVAPNAYSIAQAMFNDAAWFRAVYAGKAPVGFVMLEDNADKQEYYLWRFMIAPPFQKRGYGALAIAQLVEYVKTRPGAKELLLGYIDHPQGPAEFYRRLGFSETGKIEDGEVEMQLTL